MSSQNKINFDERYQEWKNWNHAAFTACPKKEAVYFQEELRHAGITSLDGVSIVEIGCGDGQFAVWAKRHGAAYIGTECIADIVQQGKRAGFDIRNADLPLSDIISTQSTDIIVAFDIFEHLEEGALHEMLLSCFRILRPSGRLIARVPSGDSPFSRAIQHGDATHRLTLGSSVVQQYAAATGFHVQSISQPAFPLRSLGLRTFFRRAIVLSIQAISFPIISRAFMGGGRPVLTPNMIFVLVKP